MNMLTISRKIVRGLPYLFKEIRTQVSNHTPVFVAKPRVVHLMYNGPCNARCIMCAFGFLRGDALKQYTLSPFKDEQVPGLLDQIHQLGGRGTMVNYSCGEPLLRPSLMNWLDQARKLKLDFRFTTNGYTINSDIARRLVASNLFNIGVSIESLDPSINETIRPYPNGTVKTITAIELLLEERHRQRLRLSVNIKVTLTQVNIESILDIVKRWGKVDGVLVTPQMFEVVDAMPVETREKLWIKDIARIKTVASELKRLKAAGYNINASDQALDDCVALYEHDPEHKSTLHHRTVLTEDRGPCLMGTDNLYITNGMVCLCPFFSPIGSVLNNGMSLKELWYGDKAHQQRALMRKCRTVCTLSCTRPTPFLEKVKIFLNM